jgi:putative transposase
MTTIRQHIATYAITVLTCQRKRHFQRTVNAALFIETLFRYRDAGRFLIHAFVVMPDHVHILITPAMDQSTSKCIQLIKGGYSHAAREQSPGEIWHAGYHEHRIRDASDFAAQKQYIALNPLRKFIVDHLHVHTQFLDRLDPDPAFDL